MSGSRLALIVAAAAVALTMACAEKKPEPTMSADDPASRDACFAAQQAAVADVYVWVEKGGRPIVGTTAEGLYKAGWLKQPLVCPAGGDFVFVPTELGFDCSIHGMLPQ